MSMTDRFDRRLLAALATDMNALGEFMRWKFAEVRGVRACRSLIVLRQTKNEHILPPTSGLRPMNAGR